MKRYKAGIGYAVVALTIVVFIWYIHGNPEVVSQLKHTKLSTALLVLTLYGCMTATLILLYKLMLDLCDVRISRKENALLTMYSSVVNFFGPLQSGPGFRLVYLKKKFSVSAKAYAAANILYYAVFAAVSGAFLLSGVLGFWTWPLLGLGLLAGWMGLPYLERIPKLARLVPHKTKLQTISLLALATFSQLLLVATIYFVELTSLQPGVSYSQAIVYAGAANFSLFVSLTPGALGFRESFLFFSQRLHHIPADTIVSANILDRALYVLFLGILFLVILLLHGKQQLGRVKPQKSQPHDELSA